jgi:hypothetical protein
MVTVPATLLDFRELLDAVDTEDPDPKEVAQFQRLLDERPEIWSIFADANKFVQDKIIGSLLGGRVSELSARKGADVVRDELGYENVSQLERLLIDHLVTCWLRLQDVEWRYQTIVCGSESRPIYQVDWWERRLSATQRRYLRACETLARVRKLTRGTRPVQVNIAAAGGQQVNVVGDVEARNNSEAR